MAELSSIRQNEIRKIRKERRRLTILSVSSILALLAIWQFVVHYNLVSTRFIESPLDILKTIIRKISEKKPEGGLLHQHIIESAKVVWFGFFVGSIIGIPLGLFMGWYRKFDRVVRPLFELVRPIPALAWIPIVLLFLGIGVQARTAIIFFGSFVGLVLNSYTGIRQTNPVLINVAKTCGATDFEIFMKVGIPSSMPMIFAGLKIAMGAAWGTVVAAEMLAASKGLGYLIQMGRMLGEVSLILSGIIVIGICGLISSWSIVILERIVLRWRPPIR